MGTVVMMVVIGHGGGGDWFVEILRNCQVKCNV